MKLYHGTSIAAMEKIRREGLKPVDWALGVYFTDLPEVAETFCKFTPHRTGCAAMCEVALEDLDKESLETDWVMVEDPTRLVADLAGCLDENEDVDRECWANHLLTGPDRDRDWEKSLEVAHSVLYIGSVPANKIRCRVVP